MVVSELARQARLTFSAAPDAPSLPELSAYIDDFISGLSPAEVKDVSRQLEDELQAILDDVVDHSYLYHAEALLTILYHLRAIITPLSIISSWFDLVLRPALREPKLATHAVNYAKELILSALHADDQVYSDKVNDFRRLLFDLYLLDALNEGSNEDILEWAGLDQIQKERKSCWKANLEDILLRFGEIKPHDLMTELFNRFSNPSARLQLMIFTNLYVSNAAFESSASTLVTHPLMTSILHSVLLDNSTTCCTIGLTVLVKLLPIFAVHAPQNLAGFVPILFAILARIACWKQRLLNHDIGTDGCADELDPDNHGDLQIRTELEWQRLETTFLQSSPVTSLRPYFTFLYYLFPLNLFKFLRGPGYYLSNHNFRSPYTVDWDDVLDHTEIRNRIEPLIQQHLYHSVMVWSDDVEELARPAWSGYEVSRIITSAMLLDARNATLAFCHDQPSSFRPPTSPHSQDTTPPKISLQDMVKTSIILKSSLSVDTQNVQSHWSDDLFTNSEQREAQADPVFIPEDGDASQALSALQRDVLLLRNELNFELWLSRENMRHIGRLWQDRALSQSAEVERQGLYNKLRNYRTQVVRLEGELREHKEQASSAKHKYADWNTELQNKLREFREEKKTWQSETAKLRAAAKEAEAKFVAQGRLLAEAQQQVFELETRRKENQHKIDRLKDYEKQLEQYFKMQCLWDDEFAKFNERGEEIERVKSLWKQMEQRLESLQMEQVRLEDTARGYRRQIQKLESQLSQVVRLRERRTDPALDLDKFAKEKDGLLQSNKNLRETNADLREENEELRAMVEVLKCQVSGRQGLVPEPRASPVF